MTAEKDQKSTDAEVKDEVKSFKDKIYDEGLSQPDFFFFFLRA